MIAYGTHQWSIPQTVKIMDGTKKINNGRIRKLVTLAQLSDTYDIFRIPVFAEYTNLDNKAMSDYSLSLMEKDEGRKLSNEGGWQSKDLTVFTCLSTIYLKTLLLK